MCAGAMRVSTLSLANRFWRCLLIMLGEVFMIVAICGLVLLS